MAGHVAERGQWWPDSWFGRFWILFGFAAQLIFTARFLVQWLASERKGKSYIPVSFWYLSLVGAAMLLIYAVFWKHDPVVALGQSTGGIVYVRNLMLIKKERKRQSSSS
ncbi:MAG: lipid-A-disaccharide synthase N-terminal domain-containing protein [Candidatus Hydrogenedentes bacterium]|nr:lipid-A-disaccharide synthase N-terminal domain-containing protein [Candidatus Hydrogenedentota bacterium]